MKTRMLKGVKVTASSDNVFLDLGFGKIEAEDLKRRSALMTHVERFVKASKLTHAEMARALGTTEAQLTRLSEGKIQHFTVESLEKMLVNAGCALK
jgi:predicted XRE-type DNA-binding protein